MSMTTHCPRCAATFLVSEQQLGEAQGWVRCGLCQEVFIAQAHASPNAAVVPPEQPLPLQRETGSTEDADVLGDAAPQVQLASAQESVQAPLTHSVNKPHKAHGIRVWLVLWALVALLVLQLVAQAHIRITTDFPQAVGWLQSLCAAGRCGIRNIHLVAIEDSQFSATGPNHFHLRATIANQSRLALESPVLSLSLTDANDQVLARKNLAPQDWGTKGARLADAARSPVDVWIKWEAAATTPGVVGYRLQAFYP